MELKIHPHKTVSREIDAYRIVFTTPRRIFFGSIQALNRQVKRFDVAACLSPWVWRHGYQRNFALDIYMQLNFGLVVCRAFALECGTVNATRPSVATKYFSCLNREICPKVVGSICDKYLKIAHIGSNSI